MQQRLEPLRQLVERLGRRPAQPSERRLVWPAAPLESLLEESSEVSSEECRVPGPERQLPTHSTIQFLNDDRSGFRIDYF